MIELGSGRSSIGKQNLNENLETHHLAPTLIYHLPGFYHKTGFLNTHPLSLVKITNPNFGFFSRSKNKNTFYCNDRAEKHDF